MGVTLLARDALVKTGEVDHASWNYEGLLGFIIRRRYDLVRSLMPKGRIGKVLEVGYGSGVFLPELAKHAEEVYGADVHYMTNEVEEALSRAGVSATLATAPAESLPYDDETFDLIVVVSTFEFVSDAHKATSELSRVLKPDGRVIVVTPGENPLLDKALKLLTGESAEKDFGDRRSLVVPALKRGLKYEKSQYFPAPYPLPIYHALRLAKR